MRTIFADTSYFVAVSGLHDSYLARAVELSGRILGRIITTEFVLVETGTMLSRPLDRSTFIKLMRDLELDPTIHILPASQKLFRAGFELVASCLDKEWSFVGCISFAVMKQRRLKEALTNDHHFVQAGFRALMS